MTAEQIYVGSYTSQPGGGEGIGFGTLDGIAVAATTADPSFLVRSADGRFLYATNEEDAGRVSAFAIQADGGLEFLNDQPTGGVHPCHLGIDPTGQLPALAPTTAPDRSRSTRSPPTARSVRRRQILQREGTGPNAERQEGPHAHQVAFDPAGAYVFDVDLGSDTVYTSTLTADGAPRRGRPAARPPGRGAAAPGVPPGRRRGVRDQRARLDAERLQLRRRQAAGRADRVDAAGRLLGRELPGRAADLRRRPLPVRLEPRRQHDRGVRDAADGLSVELVQTHRLRWQLAATPCLQRRRSRVYASNEQSDPITPFTVGADGTLTQDGESVNWPKPTCVLPV